jgi:hypothetical protein
MSQHKKLLLIFITIGFWQFIFAFFAAPHACEWGLPAYFWFGVMAAIILIILPFYLLWQRGFAYGMLISLCYGIAEISLWTVGVLVADIQLICRLF